MQRWLCARVVDKISQGENDTEWEKAQGNLYGDRVGEGLAGEEEQEEWAQDRAQHNFSVSMAMKSSETTTFSSWVSGHASRLRQV